MPGSTTSYPPGSRPATAGAGRADARPGAWRRQTRCVRGGTVRSPHGETCEALYLTSGFTYDSAETAEARFAGDEPGFVYSRYANPTVAMFETRLALIEGAEACSATASGMAAVTAALLCQLEAGDRVVAARTMFGSCNYVLTEVLPRFGVEIELVDGPDRDAWRAALARPARCVFFETPANPTLCLVDIATVAELAHAAEARVVVDNALATPLLQSPLALGADVVVYSATKHIDGQGRCLGGAILGSAKFRDDLLRPFLRHTGPALSPFNAWLLLKGLETLELRLERQCRTAARLADLLAGHGAVRRVYYPTRPDHPQVALAERQMAGGGTLVSFELAGGREAAYALMNALALIDISNNLGDSKSLITHPASSTHRSLTPEQRRRIGVDDALLRLSVGLEDARDLADDLTRALDAAPAA